MIHPLEQCFSRLQKENPNHSSYINFVRAIKGRGYEKGLVFRYFSKLVDREDYIGVPREELLNNLLVATSKKNLILSHLKIEDLKILGV